MQLEFVNISGSEPWKNKEAKKFVRSHAMKDFRRRQREGALGHDKGMYECRMLDFISSITLYRSSEDVVALSMPALLPTSKFLLMVVDQHIIVI